MTTYQTKITLLGLALATSICSAQEDPRRLVDEPSDKRTLGYGTSGIAEEVEDPGLGSRSMFGEGQDAREAPTGD